MAPIWGLFTQLKRLAWGINSTVKYYKNSVTVLSAQQ
jgi:hypothetical protein